jgi:signal transduction histidine kinase
MADQEEGSPSIADKLARLAALEADFQRVLEAEKLEAMAEFAAGAGHEINNPLTVISGRAQLLLREESDPERQHALALISAQAMRVYEMIADMMLFARPPRPEFQLVDLVELVERVVADFLPRCARQETAICRSGEPGPIVVEADPVQLGAALRAMCQNSMEAVGSGGHVEISVQQSDGEARVRIHDDGPGIKPEERRHIFDPFYSARQAGRGLGLGLSKAWRIVTNHGGRIEVASQPGHEATLTICLPGKRS